MKHTPSKIVVYESTDYSSFSFITGNRPLNPNKITRIIKDIEGGNDMLKDYPIQVRKNGGGVEILDGQNRFTICKKLQRPVHYILVAETKSMADIATVNSNTEKWVPQNYINCYIKEKNPHYKKLQAFIDEFKFIDTGMSVLLLLTGSPLATKAKENVRELFTRGKFQVKFWNEAVQIAKDTARFSASEHYKDRAFMIALYKIKIAELITMDELVKAFNKKPEMLQKQATQKGYVVNLEEIASLGKHKRMLLT